MSLPYAPGFYGPPPPGMMGSRGTPGMMGGAPRHVHHNQSPHHHHQQIPSLLSLRPSFTGPAGETAGTSYFDCPRRAGGGAGSPLMTPRYAGGLQGSGPAQRYPGPPGGPPFYSRTPANTSGGLTAGGGAYSCQCCVPTGCGHYSDDPVDPNNPKDAAVRVFCSNPDCAIGRWMHGDCYEYWETRVANYLRPV